MRGMLPRDAHVARRLAGPAPQNRRRSAWRPPRCTQKHCSSPSHIPCERGERAAIASPFTASRRSAIQQLGLSSSALLLPLLGQQHAAVAAATAENPAGAASSSGPAALPQAPRGPPQPSSDVLDEEPKPGQSLPSVPLITLRPVQPGRKGKQRGRGSTGARPGADETVQVSHVMKGCWQLDGAHHGDPRTDRTAGRAAILDFDAFVDAGITTFDTADVWGPSESLVGQYLRLNPWQRDSVQLVTHLTIFGDDLERLSSDYLQYRLRASLARMGVPRVDLVLLQWEEPLSARGARGAGLVDSALWLGDLQAAGLAGGVGVANLDVPSMLQVLDAGVPLAAAQVQLSVLDRRPCLYLQPLAEARGFSLLATGTLAGGWLSRRWLGRPANKARLDTLSKAKHGALLRQAGGWSWLQETLQALDRVATKHQAPMSAVALRWALDQPGVAAASVGARNARHVRATRAAMALSLDEEDLLELDAAYEGCPKPPVSDVFTWERGGDW